MKANANYYILKENIHEHKGDITG